MTFFDKMSYHGARVKIRSGMVRLLIPCVFLMYILFWRDFVIIVLLYLVLGMG